MALYVKDEEVDRLAEEVQAAYGVKTKTEAVKIALKRALEAPDRKSAVLAKVEAVQKRIREDYGRAEPNFDQKAYFDEMWGT